MLPHSLSFASRVGSRIPAKKGPKPACDPEDARLVAATLRGDSSAFESLVHKYQDRLVSSLKFMGEADANVQDAVQEAFLRAYLKLHTFNSSSAFYSWLYRIAVNAVITQRRRRLSDVKRESLRARLETVHNAQGHAPDRRLLIQESGALVQDALASLSSEHRLVLVLREIDDCDYDEIACLLHIPLGTVRSRLHRARMLMREKLTNSGLHTEASQP